MDPAQEADADSAAVEAETRIGGISESLIRAMAAADSATTPGGQSLLLEAQGDGTTGAIPLSGTISWRKRTDENGRSTLIGEASIPARSLQVSLLLRRNSDPKLPASHVMEINFRVSDDFVGSSIAGLPGVLLKDEELTQGQPLVGASARVIGNSFVFALSGVSKEATAYIELLRQKKWIDIALIYASDKRATLTLEKDDGAMDMFADYFSGARPVATDELTNDDLSRYIASHAGR